MSSSDSSSSMSSPTSAPVLQTLITSIVTTSSLVPSEIPSSTRIVTHLSSSTKERPMEIPNMTSPSGSSTTSGIIGGDEKNTSSLNLAAILYSVLGVLTALSVVILIRWFLKHRQRAMQREFLQMG